jgi:hypothetical protein
MLKGRGQREELFVGNRVGLVPDGRQGAIGKATEVALKYGRGHA